MQLTLKYIEEQNKLKLIAEQNQKEIKEKLILELHKKVEIKENKENVQYEKMEFKE